LDINIVTLLQKFFLVGHLAVRHHPLAEEDDAE